ncbi:collagen-binding domain-containing protein [Levilactobacillus spicheri]|uniref:Choice-of-anchor A domain-containing protein n=2 Tax=Levilactobacillus spicheri TaxID=216463 RepID=A0ABQ0WTI7_9LACO|nr:collagen-binding domain-containing protein [Levilactobacillus spicheri]KRL48896.1 hypothetical protein FD37_GL001366 [Levilactobacillus spicheri DSM 15429]GEO67875.1 hypothetical protein LSP04_22940 [Levilactobacillus spicheri]
METKQTHFKMYKDGRKWVFACALVLVMGGTATVAHADTDTGSAAADSSSQVVASGDAGNTGNATGNAANDASQSSSADSTNTSNDQTDKLTGTDTANGSNEQTNHDSTDSNGNGDTQDVRDTNSAKEDTNNNANNDSSASTNQQGKLGFQVESESVTADSAANADDAAADPAEPAATPTPTEKTTQPTTTQTPVATAANAEVQDAGSVYDDFPDADLNNILGVSSYFHIFANEATLGAHTNGNVAVGLLHGQVNFGTNIIEALIDKDISYIQSFDQLANSSFVMADGARENKVVFGEGVEIDFTNPSRPKINGVDIDHLNASEVFQDKNGNTYIDFAQEFAKLKQTNASVADWPSVKDYTSADFPDMNNRVIDVTDMTPDENGRIVISLSPDVLQMNTPLTIKGLDPDEDGNTVIINVDTGNGTSYDMNSQIKIIYSDGTERNNHETEYFGDNHLLWNFIDRSASDKQFAGDLNFNNTFQGSVLAPSADITVNHNLDGNIIGNKVTVKGETHRWDLQDRPNTDKPEIAIPLPGEEGPKVPEEPEPEKPGTEEPGNPEPETPGTEEPGEVDETGEEEGSYGHHHADEEEVDEYEEAFEEADTPAEEAALLTKIEDAIAQAEAAHDTYLVTQLKAILQQLLTKMGYGNGVGLPQTGETHSSWVQVLGLALAATTLGGWLLRKRQN